MDNACGVAAQSLMAAGSATGEVAALDNDGSEQLIAMMQATMMAIATR